MNMKKLLSVFLLTVALGTAAMAQCEKTVAYHSSKQEMLNANGDIEHNEEDDLTLEIGKEKLTLAIVGKEGALSGNIKETDCQWKTKYVEGKVVYKVDFIVPEKGEAHPGTLTIEAKDSQITIIVTFDEQPGQRVRVIVDKYEEK